MRLSHVDIAWCAPAKAAREEGEEEGHGAMEPQRRAGDQREKEDKQGQGPGRRVAYHTVLRDVCFELAFPGRRRKGKSKGKGKGKGGEGEGGGKGSLCVVRGEVGSGKTALCSALCHGDACVRAGRPVQPQTLSRPALCNAH